jgi:hypothetical protein
MDGSRPRFLAAPAILMSTTVGATQGLKFIVKQTCEIADSNCRDDMNGAYHKIRGEPVARPSGCPVDHGFTPFDAQYLRDPYPQLERLNAEQPVFYAEQLGCLVLTRMEDLVEIFRNHEIYSSENVQDPVFAICPRAAEILSSSELGPVAVMSNRRTMLVFVSSLAKASRGGA